MLEKEPQKKTKVKSESVRQGQHLWNRKEI